MKLALAQHYGRKIRDWLQPYCQRIELAGDARREMPDVDRIAVVCIPDGDRLVEFLNDYVRQSEGKAWYKSTAGVPNHKRTEVIRDEKKLLLHLPKCELDILITDADLFITRWIEHSTNYAHWNWLCGAAKRRPGKSYIDPQLGLFIEGQRVFPKTEEEFFAAIGMPFIPPERRH